MEKYVKRHQLETEKDFKPYCSIHTSPPSDRCCPRDHQHRHLRLWNAAHVITTITAILNRLSVLAARQLMPLKISSDATRLRWLLWQSATQLVWAINRVPENDTNAVQCQVPFHTVHSPAIIINIQWFIITHVNTLMEKIHYFTNVACYSHDSEASGQEPAKWLWS